MNDGDNIVVGGRNLQIRYSNDKSGPKRGGGNGNNNNSGKKGPATEFGIFVGNISYKCTENGLKKFFKECGKVVDVRLAKKRDGKLKGFAHVILKIKKPLIKLFKKMEKNQRALKIDKSTGRKGGAGSGNRGGQGRRGGRGREPDDPLAKSRRNGGIIAPTENKVTTYDDSSDDE